MADTKPTRRETAPPLSKSVPSTLIPLYDVFVVGGGPAGLSAALQLARFNRQVLVFDTGQGRSTFQQVTENYLGFPGGIAARDFRNLARAQVLRYPVAFVEEGVTRLDLDERGFAATTDQGSQLYARTVILATGVKDHFPEFPLWESYVGRSVFWCIVCDGYSTRGKRLVLVGNDDEAAVTALQFLQFTTSVLVLTNDARCAVSAKMQARLHEHKIPLVKSEMAGLHGRDGVLLAVELRDGQHISADFLFSLQGSTPNSQLAITLGAKTSATGFIVVDVEQHTSVPGLFAAGDVTRIHAHQVATATHEGLTAATAAQYFLYEPWQHAPQRGS